MTINLVGPRKSAVFKHSLRGESSGSARASGALAGPAHTRLGPAEAITRPSPWRRHRAPGFKDKAVISDAQQPEGAGRAPCHLASHYTNAPHGAEPPQGHTARALLHRLALGFAVSFQTPQQPKSCSLFHPGGKSGDTCEIIGSGEKTLSGKEKAHSSFATVWIMAIKSNGSAEITDINSAYTPLSHQCAPIKRDKNVHLEINL